MGTWRGWHWARTWTVATLGLGAIGAALFTVLLVRGGSLLYGLGYGLTAASWELAAVTLERSEAIDAYIEYRENTASTL